MYKCRICGKIYDKIEDVIACEQKCLLQTSNKKNEKEEPLNNTTHKQATIISTVAELKRQLDSEQERLRVCIEDINDLNEQKDDLISELDEISKDIIDLQKKKEEFNNNIAKIKKAIIQEEKKFDVTTTKKDNGMNKMEFFVDGKKVDMKQFEKNLDMILKCFEDFE